MLPATIPSINGGTQASSNGDAALYGGAYQGRFNYKTGSSSMSMGVAVAGVLAAILLLRGA